jgi:NADH:ubiquinone oxidoreductase subunit 3 (subunit A)
MVLKLLPLLVPIFIYLIILVAKSYLRSLILKSSAKKNEAMIACYQCGTYTHESLLIRKFGKQFCSDKCSSI